MNPDQQAVAGLDDVRSSVRDDSPVGRAGRDVRRGLKLGDRCPRDGPGHVIVGRGIGAILI